LSSDVSAKLKVSTFYGFHLSRKSEAQDRQTDGRTDCNT